MLTSELTLASLLLTSTRFNDMLAVCMHHSSVVRDQNQCQMYFLSLHSLLNPIQQDTFKHASSNLAFVQQDSRQSNSDHQGAAALPEPVAVKLYQLIAAGFLKPEHVRNNLRAALSSSSADKVGLHVQRCFLTLFVSLTFMVNCWSVSIYLSLASVFSSSSFVKTLVISQALLLALEQCVSIWRCKRCDKVLFCIFFKCTLHFGQYVKH